MIAHPQVKVECEALGLTVREEPAYGFIQAFSATSNRPGIRVYWRASRDTGRLVGLPRVVVAGVDTHARTLREIRYLVLGENAHSK